MRRSRREQRRTVLRASILLDSLEGHSDQAVATKNRVHRNTVVLCIAKCLQFGLDAALRDLQRPGKPRRVSDDAKAWVLNLACQKPKAVGYAYELWTYQLLTEHIRVQCGEAGYPELANVSRSKVHHLLSTADLRPHKIRYYVENRDPDVEAKLANVLHVYKEVAILNDGLIVGTITEPSLVTISYDEKTGIQALSPTTPDLPPVPGKHPSVARDYEYVRPGTLSLLAGIDLHTGQITELISETHKSKGFVAFLEQLDHVYPQSQVIRLLLDNHSAHISQETKRYLATKPQRFQFVFTPTHGSWLNIIEVLFSQLTRTMLRGLRVASKAELTERLHQYFRELNAAPVVFRWKCKIDEIV